MVEKENAQKRQPNASQQKIIDALNASGLDFTEHQDGFRLLCQLVFKRAQELAGEVRQSVPYFMYLFADAMAAAIRLNTESPKHYQNYLGDTAAITRLAQSYNAGMQRMVGIMSTYESNQKEALEKEIGHVPGPRSPLRGTADGARPQSYQGRR